MSDYSDDWDAPESIPFRDSDRKYIQRDYTERVHEDCCEEFSRIANIYNHIREMEPDKKSDKLLRKEAMKRLQDYAETLELPTGSIAELFNLSITIDCLRSKHYFNVYPEQILGGKNNDATTASSLPRRLEAYLKEHNISYYCQEVYDSLLKFQGKSLSDTYRDALVHYYEELINKPTLESLAIILEFYNADLPKCEDYLDKMSIPNSSKEEFTAALKQFTSSKRTNYYLDKKLTQLKEIIQSQYSDDAELLSWAKDQEDKEIAQAAWEYGCVGNTTLILGIILIIAGFFTGVTFIPGIVLFILWVLLFKTSLGGKIGYLRTGKEAAKKVAEKKAAEKKK